MSLHKAVALATAVTAFAGQLPGGTYVPQHAAAAQLASQAYREYSQKNYAASVAHFEAYLEMEPRDANATLQVAYAQAALPDHRSSALSFGRYLALRPNDTKIRLARGYEYYAAGEFGPAAQDFHDYLTYRPNDARVWLQLAYAQRYARWAQHDRTASVAALTRYLELAPRDARARSERAYDYLDMGKMDDARSDFDLYLKSKPGDAPAWLQVSYLSEAAHDWHRTADELSRYIELSHSTGAVRLRRALAYMALGQEGPAIDDLRAFTPAKNEDARAALEFAYAASGTGHADVAVVAFDRYIELVRTDDRARLGRAYALKASGKSTEARRQLAELQSSSDGSVANQATLELEQFGSTATLVPRNSGASGSIGYESRFGDVVTYDEAVIAGRPGPVQPYGVLHFSSDSRSSRSGTLPAIYNDNAAIFDVGLRHNVGAGHFFLEGGFAHSLLGEPDISDLRYGFATYLQTGTEHTAQDSFYFNVAGYSRYAGNVIGDAVLRHEFQLTPSFFGIIGVHTIADTHRDFYNNVAELQAGIRIGGRHGIKLLAVKGWYTGRGIARPTASGYFSFRPEISWDTSW